MVKQNQLTYLRWEIYNGSGRRRPRWGFTIIGIALFIAGILFVGHVLIYGLKPQMTITGDFAQVNGLKNGNAS